MANVFDRLPKLDSSEILFSNVWLDEIEFELKYWCLHPMPTF
jgi:hypothetical protein